MHYRLMLFSKFLFNHVSPSSSYTLLLIKIVVILTLECSIQCYICYTLTSYFIYTDEEQPTIESCPAHIEQETDDGRSTAMVTWQPPVASDNSGEDLSVKCDPASGSNFNIGMTIVTCEALDSSGNKATCGFQVIINGM